MAIQGLGNSTEQSELAFNKSFETFQNDVASHVSDQSNSSNSDSLTNSNSSAMQTLTQELQEIMSALTTLEEQLQQLESNQGGSGSTDPSSGSGSTPGSGGGVTTGPVPGNRGGNDKWYDLASGASTGDPHLSFDGSNSSGNNDGKWDNMQSHHDLIDANKSFMGGYQVSTTATDPSANGITYNKTATVATGSNRDTVTMGPNGQVSVIDDGQSRDLEKGQSLTLSSGAVVSEAKDGSVTVDDKNHRGGEMSTTMSENGAGGIDISFNSSNTFLGGNLANHGTQSVMQPLVG